MFFIFFLLHREIGYTSVASVRNQLIERFTGTAARWKFVVYLQEIQFVSVLSVNSVVSH